MTWRWKLFLLCNTVVVAGSLFLGYFAITTLAGESLSSDGHGGLLIIFLLFLLVCMLVNGIFNIYCAQRFLPDRPIHESVKKLYRFLSFFSLVSVVIMTLFLYFLFSELLRRNVPLRWQSITAIVFWLSQLIAQILQFQLPGYLLRQSKTSMRNLIDSIGAAEKEES